jgi:hypothetical protein
MVRRWIVAIAVLGFLLLGWHVPLPAAVTDPPATCTPNGTCGKFGTSVQFVSTPSEAGKRALKEEKLVLVLHVSGHFEDSKFT